MDHKLLRKAHPQLFKLYVKHKYSYGVDPTPQQDKNYIISIINESRRCFVVLEYNDGWYSEDNRDINIPSKEIISYSKDKSISENEFISLLIDIIQIYSTEELNNQVVVCIRTNGAGRGLFDTIRKETLNMMEMENIQFFPTARRSKYGTRNIFKSTRDKRLGNGWEMKVQDDKECLDAMRTAIEQGYFITAAEKSRQIFQLTSNEEQIEVEPFHHCWAMLSFIRLSNMYLFSD